MAKYRSMTNDELNDAYFDRFGDFFQVAFGDYDPHREDIIACLETGRPQDVNAYWASIPDVPEGAVA